MPRVITRPDKMYPLQTRVLAKLTPRRRALFLRYGSGKSWIALDYIDKATLGLHKWGCEALIFCRKRNILTWQRELYLRRPTARVFVGRKGLAELIALYARTCVDRADRQEVYLIFPHQAIRTEVDTLEIFLRRCPPAGIIMDESTVIKNPKTKITQAVIRLAGFVPDDTQLLVLHGKPMPEGPHEIWSQFEFAYRGANPLGDTYYQFLRKWFIKTDYAWALNLQKTAEFFRIVHKHSVSLDSEDIMELEKLIGIQERRYVMELYEETKEQRDLLDHLYEDWCLPTDDFDNSVEEYDHTMSLLMKAQQIASGFYYTHKGEETVYLRKNPKLELLAALCNELFKEDPGRKIVIWQAFQAERGPMQLKLASELISTVIGPDAEALLAFTETHQTAPRVIIMPAQTSQGFNELTLADTNIFYSGTYSAELREQAEMRLDRLGQRATIITHIDICSPNQMDMEIVTAQQGKNATPARLNAIVRHHLGESPRKRNVEKS